MTTGELIKKYRKEKGMTQKELAEAAGYAAHTTIVKVEQDTIDLPISKLAVLADVLGVLPSDLMGDEKITPVQLNEREENVINLFRGMSEEKQDAFLAFLESQIDRKT